MKTILFPTRGGQTSYSNQDAVIALAKQWHAQLIFLHISNVHFLEKLGHVRHKKIVQNELEDMAEFLLAMACERAEKAGWKAKMVRFHACGYHNRFSTKFDPGNPGVPSNRSTGCSRRPND
jgi:hypothetical protein